MFSRWGAFVYRFRRPIVLVSVIVAIAGAMLATQTSSALSAGGWLGGAITYVHGMRVLSLPDEPAARAASPVPHEEKVKAEA